VRRCIAAARTVPATTGDFEIVDNAARDSSKSTPICIRMDDDQVKRDAIHCSLSAAAAASIFHHAAVIPSANHDFSMVFAQ